MTLRYIFHSGFLLETSQCILVFDYWMDPAGVMSVYMNTCKPVYVFSSHFHEDHFTKEILKWKNNIPNITYILSKDILKRRRAQKEDADVWMVKGTVWEDECLKVTASSVDKTPTAKSANPDLITQCIKANMQHNSVSVKIVQYHKGPLLIETHDMATEAMAKTRKEYYHDIK